jgi:hypothetical protein
MVILAGWIAFREGGAQTALGRPPWIDTFGALA